MLEAYWELVKNQGRFWHDGYFRLTEQGSAPATPPSNNVHLYAKDKAGVSALYAKNDAGSEYELGAVAVGSTISGGTPGSVLFVGTGPVIAQDNSNFFWDDTNDDLQIGSAGSNPLSILGRGLWISKTSAEIALFSYGTSSYTSGFRGVTARGTAGSPTATQADDGTFFGMQGRGASAWAVGTKAMVGLKAAENWTNTAQGAYIGFENTPTGSTTRREVARLTPGGILLVGVTSPILTAGIEIAHPAAATTPAGPAAIMWAYGTGAFANYQGRHARGLRGAETATQADDVICRFSGIARGATGYSAAFRAGIDFVASQNWTDAAQGAYIKLYTTPDGSATQREVARLTAAGYLGIGTDAPTQGLSLYATLQEGSTISQRRASADTGAPGIFIQKARGSVSVPAATQGSDILATLGFGGHDGSAWQLNAAVIQAFAGSLWSGSNRESYITLATTPSGSTTRAERLRLESSGDISHVAASRHRMISQNRFRYLNAIARATKITTNQSLATDTLTAISLNSETFDTDTVHDNSTNNTRLTAPIAGKYLVLANCEFDNASDTTQRLVGIMANAGTIYGQQRFVAENGDVAICSTAAVVSLAAAGYVEMVARQKSAGNLDVVASENTSLAMFYIGE